MPGPAARIGPSQTQALPETAAPCAASPPAARCPDGRGAELWSAGGARRELRAPGVGEAHP